MQLQGCDLIGITDTWWIAYMTGVLPWMDNSFLGRTGWDSEEGKNALDVREQWKCMELCLGKDDEPDESIRFKIAGGTNWGGTVVGICYRLPDHREADEAFFRQLGETSHSQALVLMEGLEPA